MPFAIQKVVVMMETRQKTWLLIRNLFVRLKDARKPSAGNSDTNDLPRKQ
jgi:hypothetical protein